MPRITLEIRRVPKAGMHQQLVDAVIDSRRQSDRAGIVTRSVQIPHLMTPDVVAAFSFTSWDDVDQMMVDASSSKEFQQRQTSIAEYCATAMTIQALDVISPGDLNIADSHYMRRSFMVAKRGEVGNLLETLLEWQQAFPDGSRPTVQKAIAGNVDQLRVTHTFRSLGDLVERSTAIATSPDYEQFRSRMDSSTISVSGYNSRIVYKNVAG